jgi:hypothetical protein
MTPLTPDLIGIHADMPASVYHAYSGASASRLMRLWRSTPAHLHLSLSEPFEATPAMMIGTLGHALVLEPSAPLPKLWVKPATYLSDAGEKPWSGNAKVCKQLIADARTRGEVPISQDDYENAHAAAAALARHPLIAPVLKDCDTELTLITVAELPGRPDYQAESVGIRCRFDVVPKGDFLADCKFTGQLDDQWPKHAWNSGYAIQAGFNLLVWNACCGADTPKTGFKFYVVENKPPFDVRVFTCTPEFIDAGRTEAIRLLKVYAECERTGTWPGSPAVETECGLPGWAAKD